jgi:DNA-directed RNA polymerase subunit K/omega
MVHRPANVNAFEFVIVSSLRAAQLMRGCVPRVPPGDKRIVIAQREVAEGMVSRVPDTTPTP